MFAQGVITNATATAAGGAATIAENGKSIVYTPPANFEGQDTFTYTVNGTLKAEVTVSVTASATETWPRFSSLADFEEYLLDDAIARYANLFGQPAYDWFLADTPYNAFTSSVPSQPATRAHSDTNVQVEGVDEGDIIEIDGDTLYILANGELVIADAWPAEAMSVLSRTPVEGNAIAEYLSGNRLAIISQKQSPIAPDVRVSASLLLDSWYPVPQRTDTWLTVFDISSRQAPQVVQKTLLDGTYVESRRIDDFVFLVLRNDRIQLPQPAMIPVANIDLTEESSPESWLPSGEFVYESREQYVERMRSQMGSLVEATLPQFTSYGADGELARAGLLHAPEDLFRPPPDPENSLVSVVSVNISNDEPGISTSAGIFTSGADKIYGSLNNLYIFDDQHSTEDGRITQILKFRWSGETGEVSLCRKGARARSAVKSVFG